MNMVTLALSQFPLLLHRAEYTLEKNLSELDVRRVLSAKCTFVPFLSWVYDRSPILPVVWRPHQEDFHNSSIYRMVLEGPMCQTPDMRPGTPQGTPESLPTSQSFPTSPAWIHREGWHFFFLSTCGMLTVGLLL